MCRWGGRRRIGIERRSPSIIVGTSFCFLWAPLLRHDWLFLFDIYLFFFFFFIFCVCFFSYPSGGWNRYIMSIPHYVWGIKRLAAINHGNACRVCSYKKQQHAHISSPLSRRGNKKRTKWRPTRIIPNITHNISNSLVWLKRIQTFRTYGECCCSLGLFDVSGRVDFIADRDGENRESSSVAAGQSAERGKFGNDLKAQ